jgi:REP-associated tyrosine transposase
MTYDSQKYHRRSIRLKGYEYSQAGAYFVTVCVQDRACLFGEVADGQMHLNDAGRIVLAEWDALPVRFPAVELDAFGIMPNHIHGIIVISTADPNPNAGGNVNVGAGLVPALRATTVVAARGATTRGATTRVAPTPDANERVPGMGPDERTAAPPPTLGDIVGAFKSLTTDLYIHGVKQSGWPPFRGRLWQRNYYEHIIRDDESLHRIRQYILDNPANWASDRENPQAVRPKEKSA